MKSIILLFFLTGVCLATILRVPDDYSKIQQAIDSCSAGDTILVSPGKYDEALQTNENSIILASYVLFTADSNYIDSTIIQGFSGPCITVEGGADSITVIGFTITGGSYKNFGSFRVGAGIFVNQSKLILKNNNFEFNGSSESLKGKGGALYAYNSEVILTDNTFQYNRSDYGGAIAADESTVRIMGNIFFHNRVQGYGGALNLASSTVFVVDNLFYQNGALDRGGAIACGSCTGHIGNNDFIENLFVDADSAFADYGGGLDCNGSSYGVLKVFGNRFKKNRANNGAAISCRNNVLLQNNIITDNKDGLGSAIYVDGNSKIINNTIYNNDGYSTIYIKSGSPRIINNIIWNNSLRNDWKTIYIVPDPGTPVVSYCDIQDNFDGTGNITVDPYFRDALNDDFHLMTTDCGDNITSPCIDTGSPLYEDSLLGCDAGLGTKLSDMGAYGGGIDLSTGIVEKSNKLPQTPYLIHVNPNPFNSTVRISFKIEKAQNISLFIFDMSGRSIRRLYQGGVSPGEKNFLWDGLDNNGFPAASGGYIVRLAVNAAMYSEKIILIK